MIAIARKELKILFSSPLAWVILALMQCVLTWIFLAHLDIFLKIQPQLVKIANPPGATEFIIAPLFAMAAVVLLMISPLLTARLIAGERRSHTLTFLVSAPISMADIVLGKFLGLMFFFSVIIALVVALSISLLAGGSMDVGLLLGNVAGLVLLCACFAALGLYISTLSAQPATAGAGTLGILLGLWVIDNVADDNKDSIMRNFSLLAHYEGFNRGVIDTFDLVYFALFIVIFLTLSVRRLDRERISG
ncbi:ABC-2 type transport system permease protein [Nitrosovibrio tenuis]|uniref:ABC-2 type transport system permease protein n=2 Tax=Nitrosovibrio tenuis TaxID=1233 RepID=A0A1H7GJ06_9PROT|nr:ABC-2 type transport system permease protein [Nitrosovibrio tenuis]